MWSAEEFRPVGRAQGATRPIATAVRWLLAIGLALGGSSGAGAQNLPENGSSPAHAGAAPKHKMISLVALSNKHVDLTDAVLSKQLDEIYPGKFWPPRQQANFAVASADPGVFLIKSTIPGAAGMFMLLSVPRPYTEFSDFARLIADPSLRREAEAQHCWLSVDLVGKITSPEDAYRFIGTVLAKLAPTDAAVLVKPEDNSAIRFDEDLRRRLAAGQFMP
jgi:hypothetical protein